MTFFNYTLYRSIDVYAKSYFSYDTLPDSGVYLLFIYATRWFNVNSSTHYRLAFVPALMNPMKQQSNANFMYRLVVAITHLSRYISKAKTSIVQT